MRLRAKRQIHLVEVSSEASQSLEDLQRSMRPKRSLSRAAYLVILGALLLLGLRAAFFHIFVPTTLGVVDGGATRISADNAGRILDIRVVPGMNVKQGQVLVHLVLANHGRETALATARIQRLGAQIESERARADAHARNSASRDSAIAATLRDKALASSAAVAAIVAQLTSAREQLLELEKDLQKFASMGKKKVIAETSYLDLRLRKLETSGSIKSLEGQLRWLEQKAESGILESDRLLERSVNSRDEALAASNVASLEAQLAEAQAELDMLKSYGRYEILAPRAGTVSWIHTHAGEFVQAGQLLLDIVPMEEARVIAYPEEDIEDFPVLCKVKLKGPGFEAEGHVEAWFAQDKQKPGTLLLPYQKMALSPAIAIRVDRVTKGVLRSGASVTVTNPVF
jgi:multidrug resistance efflux pump